MIRISVIIPVYNKERYLRRTIESVLTQTYEDFELILVNDCSTDKSENIIYRYQKQDPRIVYINNSTNKGVSYTRNLGIEKSKGEYITFLDADDEMDSKFLEKMLLAICNESVCYCGYYNVVNGVKTRSRIRFFEGDIATEYLCNICSPNTNCWLIKKSYLDKYNIRFSPDINWGEDMEFFSKVLLHNKNVRTAREYLTFYHRNQKNCLSENNINKIYKDIYWMKKLKKYIEAYEKDFKRKSKLIKAIDSYRLPAAIVYRINSNLMIEDREKLRNIINGLKEYLKKLDLSNGLRSIKLFYVYFRLWSKLQN